MRPQSNKPQVLRQPDLAICLLIALVLTACTSSTTPIPPPAGLAEATSGKVDVGSYELTYTCIGQGSPTVVLEAGSSLDSSEWELVMLYYQRYTRICAYDRANLGGSDRAPQPRTYTDMTRDLHILLQQAELEEPYVLAGHSMGGLLVRLYASQYPEEVAGLVLIDSAHPDMGARLLDLLPPETTGEDESFKTWRQYATWMSSSDGRTAFDPEGVDNQVSMAQARAVTSLGDLPLAVISRSPDNPIMVAGFPALPDEINFQLMQAWQDMQGELEGLSTNSTRFTAARSGHGISLEEPRLVVEAIRHVVDEYRAESGIAVPSATPDATAASHAPMLMEVSQRQEWKNGMQILYADIAFTDAAGDAITIVNHLVSSSIPIGLADDVIRATPAEQQQGAVLTASYRCRRAFEVVLELQVCDAAGNLSAPQTISLSCPEPKAYLSPLVIAGGVLGLGLIGFTIWLLARRWRQSRGEG